MLIFGIMRIQLLLLCFVCFSMESVVHSRTIHRRSDDADPLEALVQQQASAISTLQSQVAAVQTDVTALKLKKVAFTARFSDDNPSISSRGVLRFDTVPLNIGNGYNAHSGLFTAPYTGTYVFLFNMMAQNGAGGLQVAIDKSGTVLAIAHADSGSDAWDKGSTQVTVHLNAGEEVWVRHNTGHQQLFGTWWTVFTGFLLYAD